MQDLKTWTLGQRSFCEERFGITSQDRGLADRWPQSLPDCGYVPMDTLFRATETSAGFGRWTPNFDKAPGPMRAVAVGSSELFAIGPDGTLYRDNGDGWQGLRPVAGLPKVLAVAGAQSAYGYHAFAISDR